MKSLKAKRIAAVAASVLVGLAFAGQGNTSFQISGEVKEVDKARVSIDEEDVKLVMEKSGVSDEASAREALEESNGNIAEAILKLKGDAA